MSCTIVSTPATGATDWTDWIIQQGLTDRGFSRVSLTNFAGTAASAIGTGSVFELAGSIYNNTTETAISLATGTASASVAVYILAIPAAGGTTCTFQLDSVAPTWVDAKQGFYASAASTTRAIGGMYIGTAATYFNKWLYLPEDSGKANPIRTVVLEIGEWNMDADTTKSMIHHLVMEDIRRVSTTIRLDDDSIHYPLKLATGGGTIDGGDTQWLSSTILLIRRGNGFFDGINFNATASTLANRGWVYIDYEV